MKKILLIAAFAILLTGCKRISDLFNPHTTLVSVIGDPTDPLVRNPNDEIMNVYRMDDHHLYNGYEMRYRNISDRLLVPSLSFRLPAVSPLFSNGTKRVADINAFKANIKQVFDSAWRNSITPMSQSCIYKVIVTEANYLAEASATDKYMVIYSNLLDHDKTLDLYNPIVRDAVKNNPEQVIKSMRKVMELENLKGIKCLIVFQSGSASEEDLFLTSSSFYRLLLTNAGAECRVVQSIESNTVYAKEE